jgi:hypothetical protein
LNELEFPDDEENAPSEFEEVTAADHLDGVGLIDPSEPVLH